MKRSIIIILLLMLTTWVVAQEKDSAPILDWYGFIKVDAAYNTAQLDNHHAPSRVLPESMTNRDDNASINSRLSRIGLKINAPKFEGITATGQFEMDFMTQAQGTGETTLPLRIRLANINLAFDGGFSIMAGQCWNLVSPLSPRTLNSQTGGGYGNPGLRHQQIQLSQKLDNLIVQAGVIRQLGSESEVLPAWQARIAYDDKDAGILFGLSGLYGKLAGNDESYLLNFEYRIAFAPEFRWTGEVFLAKNAAVYGASIGQAKGEGYGLWSSLEFDASSRLMFWTAGLVDMFNNSTIEWLANGTPERNLAVILGSQYKITKATSVGLELSYMNTAYKSLGSADALRGILSLRMDF